MSPLNVKAARLAIAALIAALLFVVALNTASAQEPIVAQRHSRAT